MNRTMKVIEECMQSAASARFRCALRAFRCSPRSPGTPPLWRQQSTPQQIQVRQRKGGVQPRGVLGQAAVANLAKAPQALDHMEGMFDTGPSSGAPAVDESLILAQRPASGAPIDPIADAGGQRALA